MQCAEMVTGFRISPAPFALTARTSLVARIIHSGRQSKPLWMLRTTTGIPSAHCLWNFLHGTCGQSTGWPYTVLLRPV